MHRKLFSKRLKSRTRWLPSYRMSMEQVWLMTSIEVPVHRSRGKGRTRIKYVRKYQLVSIWIPVF